MEISSLATDRLLICTRVRERYTMGGGKTVLQAHTHVHKQSQPPFGDYCVPLRYLSSVKTKVQGTIREGKDVFN